MILPIFVFLLSGQALFDFQKIIRLDVGLFQNGTQGAFRHVAGMIGNGGVALCGWIEPDFMTARCLTVELETQLFEPFDNVAVFVIAQPSHLHPKYQRIIKRIANVA